MDAGIAALAAGGPDAVAIEPVAQTLGTSKGSGYWHFESRSALLAAVLDRWSALATDRIVEDVERAGGTAIERLERLLHLVTTAIEMHPGQVITLAHADPLVRRAVQEVTSRRVDYVTALLREIGFTSAEANRRAVLAYAAYVGYAVMAATVPDQMPSSSRARAELQRTMVDVFASPRPNSAPTG